MAKGIRSKSRKAARSEFRNTIGKEDAEQKMAIVQNNLQECISRGVMNSFERLAQQLNSSGNYHSNSDTEDQEIVSPDIDAMDTEMIAVTSSKKNPDKVPAKKKNQVKATLLKNFPSGQTGAKLARKKAMKDRKGKTKTSQTPKKRTSKKKKP
eukprot:CAMPEP_0176498558 /NCGR_PEP_ID=MMETSP0200_2-20121128/12389_1 /TAXON_ID=947934 /ORGANISM="Chaetoceros sp., Strain GSL56" /LENGTH=152 /DNA_ID=CAMNT_0017896781 /DNA_START=79 /DNA_END=534 /DNA_ORIENTATION=-